MRWNQNFLMFATMMVLWNVLSRNNEFKLLAERYYLSSSSEGNDTEHKRTSMLLYMTSRDDDHVRTRIAEMQEAFQDRFLVVWDNKDNATCPFVHIANCLDDYNVSSTRLLSNMCCAQEKAVMWAMDHRDTLNYVWFMEDDVHYTDIQELVKVVVGTAYPYDLLTHDGYQPIHENAEKYESGYWDHAKKVRHQLNGTISDDTEIAHGMYNFFRVSQSFLSSLDDFYTNKRKQEWVFFETLFPLIVMSYNLTMYDWTKLHGSSTPSDDSVYLFQYRPCFQTFSKPGIYHPVKVRDGKPVSC